MGLLLSVPSPTQAYIEPPKPDYRAMAISIAEEYDVSTTTLTNLIESETHFNPDVKDSPEGDRGIAAINRTWHAEVSDKCAYDPECAIRFAAKMLADKREDEYTVCNCYAFTKALVGKLPKMALIAPQSPPSIGSIAVYDFKGIKHLAVVTGLQEKGFTYRDANRKPCLTDTGFTNWNDPHLKGFWSSGG